MAISALVLGGAIGCFSFSDLTGGGGDAGTIDAASETDVATDADVIPIFDAGVSPDGAAITFLSCAAAHAELPNAPDGLFLLSGLDGGPTIQAYCDMTNDNGGWMLVTPDMVVTSTHPATTVVQTADDKGGLVVQNFANNDVCGQPDAGLNAYDLITFSVDRPWSQIRAYYGFNGLVTCWSVFGNASLNPSKNILPFQIGIDTIYGEHAMGGTDNEGGVVDAFDGKTNRCDGTTANFWGVNVETERSATLILRRSGAGPAGFATSANCFAGVGPGTTSHAWWEYRQIYVR
jgi:hypothetical protein